MKKMEKVKASMFSEKKLSGAIFGFLIIVAFAFVFGPNIYAQFSRQTGVAGWNYGYGYGYGYGSGNDLGTATGYRTTGSASSTYDYGFGYGYLASGVSYDAVNGFNVTGSTVSSLTQTGVITPNAGTIASTTAVSFHNKVTLSVGNETIVIPSGTTMTASSGTDFSQLAAAVASTGDLSGVNVAGQALSFGLPSLGLTLSASSTITIPVGAQYNFQNLNVYTKTSGGSSGSWSLMTTCLVSGGNCTFTTIHLSSFAAGLVASSGGSSGGGGGGGGGGSALAVNNPVCTDVSYGDYATACFNGYQFRAVLVRTPSNCTLSAAQQTAAERVCTASSVNFTPGSVVTSNMSSADFVALEKSLVVKVSAALTKRLSGRILLQVEGQGQAWYVSPVDGFKYFLGTPAAAFALMRQMALGVSNATWATFKNGKAPARLAGRILLKVQDNGMAYYVNPVDLSLHYLGRPSDAFSVMRSLGLGITNANLNQIKVGMVK